MLLRVKIILNTTLISLVVTCKLVLIRPYRLILTIFSAFARLSHFMSVVMSYPLKIFSLLLNNLIFDLKMKNSLIKRICEVVALIASALAGFFANGTLV